MNHRWYYLSIFLLQFIYPLPVAYGCEARSVTLQKEHKVSVFESRVLREYLGLTALKL
jgi:hypothetical protein